MNRIYNYPQKKKEQDIQLNKNRTRCHLLAYLICVSNASGKFPTVPSSHAINYKLRRWAPKEKGSIELNLKKYFKMRVWLGHLKTSKPCLNSKQRGMLRTISARRCRRFVGSLRWGHGDRKVGSKPRPHTTTIPQSPQDKNRGRIRRSNRKSSAWSFRRKKHQLGSRHTKNNRCLKWTELKEQRAGEISKKRVPIRRNPQETSHERRKEIPPLQDRNPSSALEITGQMRPRSQEPRGGVA